MSRPTPRPLLRLTLLIVAALILAALAYGLRVHRVGDPPGRTTAIVGTSAAAAPAPAPGPTPTALGDPRRSRERAPIGSAAAVLP
ncbi:hypothetical protein KZ813_12185 [Sphingomonas sp. RHCKR7]|uniref:hypothetical protein n=1 Tax=Sphingomonas folli TaxID=2862497 RepID=UPI001CA5ED5F|nr:hypothetical protein [Sphingomonas folli]MBW6527601.1 hypothetical protein [Sphingomonas folli]